MPQNLFAKHRQAQKQKAKRQVLAQSLPEDLNQKAGEFDIVGLSHEGRGIAKRKGKTIFIDGAYPNERVTAELIKQHRHFDELSVSKVLKASPDREEPFCRHFGDCGGCSLQSLSRKAQRAYKQVALADQFLHFGELDVENWLEPLFVEGNSYRHKARLGVRIDSDQQKVVLGFRKKHSNDLCDIQNCPILSPALDSLIQPSKLLVQSLKSRAFITHLELAGSNTFPALVLRHIKPLAEEDFQVLRRFSEEYSVAIFLQGKAKEKARPLNENTRLAYPLETSDSNTPVNIVFHPQDFIQVNPKVNQLMVNQAIALLQLSSQDRVLDLFCGLGNFTLPIARVCQQVIGIEGVEEMVAQARQNASLNKVDNVAFFRSDLHQDIEQINWAAQHFDKALLDPPRAGALEAVNFLAKISVPRIVYISCNPATLARDAGVLSKHGYRLESSGVIDMFPHTAHIESITVFTK